ncbi:hypothetical protein SAMD00023353_2601050 [Rosellinia necatrix]|uniref:Uncharacterized protein n=1 Tax=Rosellinia necatrix TaxID=77044 RepID=A0A1W2TH74_ROSNE|nr:hypothetical protein SAMD00023353_2601050 [Rosellinia necatrix]
MDTTFSDDEKRFVLGEIIKVSTINVSTLVEFIRAQNVVPNWFYMQLPVGRNLNQCHGAVDNMFQVKFAPPNIGNLGKRKSLGDLNDHPTKRPATMAPFEPALAPVRPLQPRPSISNGYSPMVPITSTPNISSTGKKRGRPSKADKEAQAQARAAYTRPTEYTPITPAPPGPPTGPPPVHPQREYGWSPGYETAGTSVDQASKKRPRATVIDSPRQVRGSSPRPSPASTTGTPRAPPESLEQIERANLSPRAVDSRSPPLAPLIQPHDQPQAHSHILPRPQTSLVPIQPSQRLPQAYEPYRGPDPIFPDRDRSRSMPDQVPRNASASPVVNRT